MKRTDAREQETAANQTAAGMNCLTLDESSDGEKIARIRTSGLPSGAPKRPLSRLQKRAPASLQLKSLQDSFLSPADNNNRSPIPLLSPLVTSPSPDRRIEQYELRDDEEEKSDSEPFAGNLPVNGWKHPAAPFFCEKACSFAFLPIQLF